MALGTAHDVLNYTVFKGIVSLSDTGTAWVDVGDVSSFVLTPNEDTLAHYSHREGIRVKDREITITRTYTLKMVLDEPTEDNLKIALGGADLSGGGFTIGAAPSQTKHVKLVGTNSIGIQGTLLLYPVTFKPNGDIEFIGEDSWSQITIEGEVLTPFGTWTPNA
jgi:hypothetical protein